MKKLTVLFLAGLTAVLALSVAAPAVAKKGKRHAVAGVVQSVGTSSLTLKVKNRTVTVQVDTSTKIVVSGHAATLGDIQPGYVAVVRGRSGQPAKSIHAGPRPAPGTVARGVVKTTGTDSITLTTKGGTTVTIGVTNDTKIRVDGQNAGLADIHSGYHAIVVRTAADGPARLISAQHPHAQGQGLVVKGTVASVGTDSLTITLRTGGTVTVHVTPSTRIRVRGHAGAATLSDIQNGYRVAVLRTAANGPALAIVAAPTS
jgi:hypothetical protein